MDKTLSEIYEEVLDEIYFTDDREERDFFLLSLRIALIQ